MTLGIPGVELRGVSKAFDGAPALSGIDLSLPGGSFTVVVGVSGCGKSTLLKLLGGLDEPTSGRIRIGRRAPLENRQAKNVGWMAQKPALLPWLTVGQNVALAQSINPRADRDVPHPRELVAMVGLAEQFDALPHTLSGGMQQRVALARTLAVGSRLWLMDEPFASLDEINRESLSRDLLEIWRTTRPTVVWVTHHVPEAVMLADEIVLLSPGPGRVTERIEVDLPRPRDVTSPEFQRFVRLARGVLWASEGKRLGAWV